MRQRRAEANEPCRCDSTVGHLCERCTRERDAHKDGLLPCPFCGGMDLTLDNLVDLDDFGINCNCCEVQQICVYTREDAIRRWNVRLRPLSPHILDGIHTTASTRGAETIAWKCGADRSGIGGNDPQDCGWPTCGCDPYANRVIEVLQESGWQTGQNK